MSNMFAMPGRIVDTLDNGIILAECFGPLNEAAVPLRKAVPVKSGMKSITAAKENAPYPVGTPIPVMKLSDNIKNKLTIPMTKNVRSLNIASSVAIVGSEALRQINL